jgi:hypothetical protein
MGIALCLSRGIPLTGCQCFIDLSLAETKERVKAMMVTATEDWTRPSEPMILTWGGESPRPSTSR